METLIEKMKQEGYTHLQYKGDILIGVYRYMFTWGLIFKLDEYGYDRRYCFKTLPEVVDAIAKWDPSKEEHPSGNWIKCKGDNCDFMNPNYVPPTTEELIIK